VRSVGWICVSAKRRVARIDHHELDLLVSVEGEGEIEAVGSCRFHADADLSFPRSNGHFRKDECPGVVDHPSVARETSLEG
jgi:hypothetical protein